MNKFAIKLINFQEAFQRLQEAIIEFSKEGVSDVIRDGLIQRFEFTYELAWKATRDYLVVQGIVDKNSPKGVIKEAFVQQLIENELVWLEMIDDRNKTTHIYSQSEAERIANMITNHYVYEFESLLKKLMSED